MAMLNALKGKTQKPDPAADAGQKIDFSAVPNTGERTNITISCRESLKDAMRQVADAHNTTPHQVATYAVRFFLWHHGKGTSQLEKFIEPPKPALARINLDGD